MTQLIEGPSLRDQFAMAALTSLLTVQGFYASGMNDEWARRAYLIADSMLAARATSDPASERARTEALRTPEETK